MFASRFAIGKGKRGKKGIVEGINFNLPIDSWAALAMLPRENGDETTIPLPHALLQHARLG